MEIFLFNPPSSPHSIPLPQGGREPVRAFMATASSPRRAGVPPARTFMANDPRRANFAERYEDYRWLYLRSWVNGN